MRGRAVFALLLFLGTFSWCLLPYPGPLGAAQPTAATVADDDDDDEEERPKGPKLAPGKGLGLVLTLTRGDATDTRPARLVALAVPEGTAPSAFLAPGPFRATWTGDITVPLKGEYDFAVAGRGTIKVEVNGKVALEGSGDDLAKLKGKTARFKKGANALVVTYDSPASGDAVVRLNWSSEDFGREPIHTTILSHDLATPELVAKDQLRQGRELLADHRCLRCHTDPAATPTPAGMPELATDAPNLDDAGTRLRAGWMARWIDDPRSLRPNATMPRVLHAVAPTAAGTDLAKSAEPSAQARDLAAYLAGRGTPEAAGSDPAPDAATVAAGGRLFAGLGCVGCHTLPDRTDWAADPERVPLRHVGAKWQPKALRAFLLQPDRHYRWIKMPNFHLTNDEATRLAAYVASGNGGEVVPAGSTTGDAEKGRSLFTSAGCASCHESKPAASSAPALAAISAEGWARGCLDPTTNPGRKAPDFGLDDAARQAVRAFGTAGAATVAGSLGRDAAPEFAERQIKALRCASCHKRDGYDDRWTDLQVETDRLAADPNAGAVETDPDGHPYPALQARPPLTWTGEKLHAEWSARFIAGTLDYKPRPYLKARMPAFPARAEGIAVGLSLEHGFPAVSPPDPAPDQAQVPDAKALTRSTGLNCVSCHKVGSVAAVGVFEAPGINFMHVRERLRKEYYDRWVRAPLRVDPDTKMPSFFNGEASVLPTILDGKAARQSEALWNYLLQGRAIEAPGS